MEMGLFRVLCRQRGYSVAARRWLGRARLLGGGGGRREITLDTDDLIACTGKESPFLALKPVLVHWRPLWPKLLAV